MAGEKTLKEMSEEEIDQLGEALVRAGENLRAVVAGTMGSPTEIRTEHPDPVPASLAPMMKYFRTQGGPMTTDEGKRFQAQRWPHPARSGNYAWSVLDTETRLIHADFYASNENAEDLAREFAERMNTWASIEKYHQTLREVLDASMGTPPPPVEYEEES